MNSANVNVARNQAPPDRSSPTARPVGSALTRENRLLASLPAATRENLLAKADRVNLTRRQVLCDVGESARHAYFPLSGLISLLKATSEGGTVELASVAGDGFVGLPIVLGAGAAPFAAVVQIPGAALRIRTEALRAEFKEDAALREAFLRYAYEQLDEVGQSSLCHRFHAGLARLCSWLLDVADRLRVERIPMTQEALAQLLGMSRTGITRAALELQDANAIRCRHGQITIIDRRRLERSACECYDSNRPRE